LKWRAGADARENREFATAEGLVESLGELVRLEADCCPSMRFVVTESPAVRLTATAVRLDGERGLREVLAPTTLA